MNFGQYVKTLRSEHNWGLRNFCRHVGVDHGNWSRVESGERNAPRDTELLEVIAKTLKLTAGERAEYYRLAIETFIPKGIIK